MTNARILCTTEHGGVAVVVPSDECISALFDGGYISQVYWGREGLRRHVLDCHKDILSDLMPWFSQGIMPLWLAREWEIQKFVQDKTWRSDRHDREVLAARWIDALIQGGMNEHAAISLIAEKDMPVNATAAEIVDVSEIPSDRFYRDAWRRSHNGGPVWVDPNIARQIEDLQISKMWDAYRSHHP